jgi:hypothetical protein
MKTGFAMKYGCDATSQARGRDALVARSASLFFWRRGVAITSCDGGVAATRAAAFGFSRIVPTKNS